MNKSDLSKLHVLLVDDIAIMRQVAASQLQALGITQIQGASNGVDALRMLKLRRYDLVLSDWNMPVMGGLELLCKMRTDPALADIPVIMLTAEIQRSRVAEAIRYGVSDFLVKPYTAQRMEEKINCALQRTAPAPIDEADAPKLDEAAGKTTPESQKPGILVVDDTHDNLRLLVDLFEDQYRVRIADNGKRALAICHSDRPPDLVLLDVMMPDMDGFEVARKMREHPNSELIPIIFVTALHDEVSRRKGLELGAVDFISKPIDPDILQIRVRNFIRHVEQHKQRQHEYDAMLLDARLRENVEHLLRHDLRGPLAGVLGLLRAFPVDGQLGPQQARRLEQIEIAAKQALDALNLSSELFQIETGRFQLKAVPLNLRKLLLHIADTHRATFAVKQLNIETEGVITSPTMGDAVLCQSVFHNLLKNACEAAPTGSRIKLTLYDENPVRIVLENPGGVPEAIRQTFFDRYATAGKQGGSGIGTYSAKLLTEAQGGKIAMETNDYMTRLTVWLPRQNGSGAAGGAGTPG